MDGFQHEHGPLPDEKEAWFSDPTNRAHLAKNALVDAQSSVSEEVAALQATRGLLVAVIADPKKAFVIGSLSHLAFPAPGFTNPLDGKNELWMPVTSDVAVSLGGPRGTEHLVSVTDHAGIRRLNELTARQSSKIGARSKELIASLLKQR